MTLTPQQIKVLKGIVAAVLCLLALPASAQTKGATALITRHPSLATVSVPPPALTTTSSFLSALTVPAAKLLPVGCNIALAWGASPDASVTGYRIYYGAASGNYTNLVTVGLVTNATITSLLGGMKYYFAATAFNATAESGFSNEVMAATPEKISLTVDRWAITTTGVFGATNNLFTAGRADLPVGQWTKLATWIGNGSPQTVLQTNGPAAFYQLIPR